MRLLDRMERKIGKHPITGLMRYVIACYIVGYIFLYIRPEILNWLTLEPFLIFHYGQAWRLISWVLIPPTNSNIIFVVIMLILYYQLGTTLERTWGAFRFNVYIFSGVIFTILGALVLYVIYGVNVPVSFGGSFSTFYINMSIFLAFAVAFPDMKIMLYFFIPIKMKWMGLVYAVLLVYEFIRAGSLAGRVAIVASLVSFLIYFLATRNFKRFSPNEVRRRNNYKRAVNGTSNGRSARRMSRSSSRNTTRNNAGNAAGNASGSNPQSYSRQGGAPIHKCAICGRTELDDPNLTFRYCSKCNGNYEYCQDHLFTHKHVQ
ncbi:MAG: rhomboid family intramembrane serine protease [Lachnospiraceae bacterium]|nr:rhomboid family intramembrane serine protease [Lachnospiraceae bacterium]